MSGGNACKCKERAKSTDDRDWTVTQRQGNRSAFNGYRHARSDYSEVVCGNCGARWRTRAVYVNRLQDDEARAC